ncbi:MAG: carbohydrate kinase family protein, partial [Egibacteraceae bacterium]
AQAGVDAHFVGVVGDDAFGHAEVDRLRRQGVTPHVRIDQDASTGVIVVLVGPDGDRTMLPDRGANGLLRAADVPAGLLYAADVLHVSGYTFLDAASRPAARHALDAATVRGVPVSVDPSSWRPLADAGADAFLAWTAGSWLCLPNAEEARVLTGRSEPDAAARRLGATYGETVVTLGSGGALWSDGDAVVRAPAPAASSPLDTTGAGDALAAGFLAARLAGRQPEDALHAALALAAVAVRGRGARPQQGGHPYA